MLIKMLNIKKDLLISPPMNTYSIINLELSVVHLHNSISLSLE